MDLSSFVPVGIIAGIVIIVLIFICLVCKSFYKVAPMDKALIITGGKEPKIIVSGGSFVVPIFRKADYFDLCMLTVATNNDVVQTGTSVKIIINWTAQIRPDTRDIEVLKKAIVSFKERGPKGIIEDVRLTLTGAVRDVVTSMTPEQVLKDKSSFTNNVVNIVADEMTKMGMELVSLNIADISDDSGYYDNIAVLDKEDKRREAENKKAEVDRDVRSKKAEAEKLASQNELASKLAIAEKEKDNNLKIAEFKVLTDKAMADAEIAGELQKTIRSQEVAEQQGRVAVIRQEQANLAAQKEKDVIATRAEADKQKKQIEAEADANMRKIEADANVNVAEKRAQAVKIEADANAEKIRKEGEADAEVIRKKGLAEADAEKAKMLAQAEGEQKLAEARASNDKVNYEIEKLKIEANAKVEIATKTATIMADIGKNAEFVNIGGSGQSKTGNVLIDTLSSVPGLMKSLNAENEALNNKSFNEEISNLVSSVFGPVKGLLASNTHEQTDDSKDSEDVVIVDDSDESDIVDDEN